MYNLLITIFRILIVAVISSYIGYMLLMWLISFFWRRKNSMPPEEYPEVTLLIAAYNEKDIIPAKIRNTRELTYPTHKLKVLWITDGSDDGSEKLLSNYSDIIVLHRPQREGKTGALNRGTKEVKTPFTVFCDANSMLNPDCIQRLLKGFSNKTTGCIAGKKMVTHQARDKAISSGEGMYWKIESILKEAESKVYSTVGAAGELYAIRTHLFEELPADTIIDDFVLSVQLLKKGFTIQYEPSAISYETASYNIAEELKRKTRIAYGSIQTLLRYPELLNPLVTGFFAFQYFFHKVLRWTIIPFSLPLIYIINFMLINIYIMPVWYYVFFYLQTWFYIIALTGWSLQNKQLRFKLLFMPYYFLVMNFALIKGYIRFFSSAQSVAWEKVKRQ